MPPKLERNDPPYLQIAEHLRGQIKSGALAEGQPIPSARQIASEWGVALATATRVHAVLRSDGLVRSVRGVGTVVDTSATGTTGRDRLISGRRTGRVYPAGERAVVRSAELVPAPDYVADALGLGKGDSVIRRQRITLRHDTPVSCSISWLPGEFAISGPKLVETNRLPQGTFGYIEETTGRELRSGRERVAAGAATMQQARELGVEAGSPVLLGRNWIYDADGGVIEFGESADVADRWSDFDYEIS
jgi:DNA-binding GntR family transcriptional regulator